VTNSTETSAVAAAASEPKHVPRFSSQGDVDEFVDMLAKFEAGELTSDQWRKFRLVRGCYGQRQENVQMQRVKIPLGYLVADQLRAVARAADAYSRGMAHVTTRQNFQFHFVQLTDIPQLMTDLVEAGITAREACGNAVRNVTGCDLAGVAKTAVFDTRAHGETLTRFFLRHPKAADLPRKFKMAVSCCPHDCAQGGIHDIGFLAKIQDGKRGFKIIVGGGLSSAPHAAELLYDFAPEEEMLEIAEAVLLVFDARGNRENKQRARLKYVLRKVGIEGLRTLVEEQRALIKARGDVAPVFTATPLPPPPPRDRTTPVPDQPSPGYLKWRGSNVKPQSQDGYSAVYVRLLLGDITSNQMRTIADLADKYGDGSVYTSAEQNLLLRFVPDGDLRALHADLVAAKLAHDGALGLRDVTSCPGAASCNLAITTSRGLGRAIERSFEAALAAGGALGEAVVLADGAQIKISGCPHSCGRHHIADLGFHGAARKVEGRAMPVYQLHVGGGVDADGARFGAQVVKIPAKRAPAAVMRFVEQFAKDRQGEESFGQYLRRLTPAEVKVIVGELSQMDDGSPVEDDFVDFDAQNGFVVETKDGECAALARDRPRPSRGEAADRTNARTISAIVAGIRVVEPHERGRYGARVPFWCRKLRNHTCLAS
jgi:sulfite reductase (ferredoxin)